MNWLLVLLRLLLVVISLLIIGLIYPLHYRVWFILNKEQKEFDFSGGYKPLLWFRSGQGLQLLGLSLPPFSPKGKGQKDKRSKKGTDIHFTKLLTVDLINPLHQLLGELIKIIKPKFVKVKGRVGFEDPSHTGYTLIFLQWLKTVLASSTIDVTGEFEEETLDLEGRVEGRIIPATIVYSLVKLALSRPFRVLFRSYRIEKKKHTA